MLGVLRRSHSTRPANGVLDRSSRHMMQECKELTDVPTWYSITEAAGLLGMSTKTAYRLLKREQFPVPAYRCGTHWRVPKAHLDKLIGSTA